VNGSECNIYHQTKGIFSYFQKIVFNFYFLAFKF
jgi:hypothetical protein